MNSIVLVTVCDDHFTILLAALIKSIELNHLTNERIDLYIVEDKVSYTNKKKITDSVDEGIIKLHWLKMEDVVPSDEMLPIDESSFPLNIYIRLLIPYFIPDHIKKVIYLDVDMITLADVSNLWSIDIGDHPVAGVPDRSEIVSNPWGGIKNYADLGIRPDVKYFNSGLLVMNLDIWRTERLTKKIINCIHSNIKFANFPDQYGINVVLANRWLELDFRWNCYAILKEPKPFIIHFIGNKPIYTSYNGNEAYGKLFFKYLNQTAWKGFKPYWNYRRYIKKLINKLKKVIK